MSIGIIQSWNDEKGFGFIKSDDFDEKIFVHISAFRNKHKRPDVGDEVVFFIKDTPKGKQAYKVNFKNESQKPTHQNYRQDDYDDDENGGGVLYKIIGVFVLGGIGYFVYGNFIKSPEPEFTPIQTVVSTPIQKPAQPISKPTKSYVCDGRQHCSQMTSKDEAQYFLKHCPDVKMDGDGDGDACEDQFGRKGLF